MDGRVAPLSGTDWRVSLSVAAPILVFFYLTAITLLQQTPVWFPLDDAYITIGNVETFRSGQTDLYGNDGPTGASSLIHFLALLLLSLIIDTPIASLLLSLLSGAFYAVGLWLLLRAVSTSRTVVAFGTITGLLAGNAWPQVLNGLETGMAMAAITWAFYFRQTGKTTGLAVLIGTLPFVRPEFYVLSALMCISLTASRPFDRPLAVQLLCISAATYAVFALVSLFTLGGILPETAGAKEAYFAGKGEPLFYSLLAALHAIPETGLILVFVGLVFSPRLRGGWVALVFLAIFVFSSALKLPEALYHNDFRYLYPFLPVAIVSWAAVLPTRRYIAEPAFVLGSLVAAYHCATTYWPTYTTLWKSLNEKRHHSVDWIVKNVPDGAVIGIHDAGFIPWKVASANPVRKLNFIDLVGLKSPFAIEFHEEFTDPSNGKERWLAFDKLGRESQIDYLVILDQPFWRDIEANYKHAGWDIELVFANKGSYQVFEANPR
ncbi:MAG: hypothetical protein AB3N19_09605 [Ruegeria sp.]